MCCQARRAVSRHRAARASRKRFRAPSRAVEPREDVGAASFGVTALEAVPDVARQQQRTPAGQEHASALNVATADPCDPRPAEPARSRCHRRRWSAARCRARRPRRSCARRPRPCRAPRPRSARRSSSRSGPRRCCAAARRRTRRPGHRLRTARSTVRLPSTPAPPGCPTRSVQPRRAGSASGREKRAGEHQKGYAVAFRPGTRASSGGMIVRAKLFCSDPACARSSRLFGPSRNSRRSPAPAAAALEVTGFPDRLRVARHTAVSSFFPWPPDAG